MEPAGLSVGIVGLASLFNDAVDCFEYVQIGRNFGKSFQTSVLKLDSARLRLSRWGESVGLSSNLGDVQTLQQAQRVGPDRSVQAAEKLLGQILELFNEAEGVPIGFRTWHHESGNEASLAVYDAQNDLDPKAASLHQKMRDLSIRRQNHIGLRQKAKWALYEEKHFKQLIATVTNLVDNLIGLFPAVQETQRQLAENEVSEIAEETASLPDLKPVVAGMDPELEAAVDMALRKTSLPSPTSAHTVFSGNNNRGFQLGQIIGNISNLKFGVDDS